MTAEDPDPAPQREKKERSLFLPKLVFVLGVILVVGTGLLTFGSWAAGQMSSGSDDGTESAGSGFAEQLTGLLAGPDVPDEDQILIDQRALPARPDGWRLVDANGGAPAYALAREVYDAMHAPDGPVVVFDLVDLAEAMSEEERPSDDPQLTLAASENAQGRVYVTGDTVAMVIIRRLPPTADPAVSWLQAENAGAPVPVEIDGRAFLESPATAGRDDIHALRHEISDRVVVEIGGRIDRAMLAQLARRIDFAAISGDT